MGCSSCSNGGIPNGCKGNGQCGTYGCNSLDVFDWLSDLKLPQGKLQFDIVEVRFKSTRKAFFRNTKGIALSTGDVVIVEGAPGYDVGVVSLTGELVRIQMQKKGEKIDNYELKKVLRKANQEEIDLCQEARKLEESTMYRSRDISKELALKMKISDVEYQGDKSKATFYYTADDRVDFRELIKRLAEEFKIRVEMRQIGARQEAARLGGIGSCGRELCCTTWLTDFRTVSTTAARYQQLSLNPQKLAGQCGKLKCCLNYELDMYVEGIKEFPKPDVRLKTRKGLAQHFKTDIFKQLVWYTYYEEGKSSDPIPIPLARAKEIIELNRKGEKPDDLKDFAFIAPTVEKKIDFTDAMGTESVSRFDKKSTKPRKGKGKGRKRPSNQQQTGAKAQSNQNSGGGQKRRNPKPQAQKTEGGADKRPSKNRNPRRNKPRSANQNKPNDGGKKE